MKLPRTLFGRLLVVFLLFGVVMTSALLYVLSVSHDQFHLEFDQTINRNLAREYVAANFFLTDRQLDATTLHQGIGKLALANPAIDVYLLDLDGRIVASSVATAQWRRRTVDVGPIKEFLAGKHAPILGDDPRQDSGRTVFSAAVFHVRDCPGDYLYLVLGRAEETPGAAKLRSAFAIREGAGIILLAAVLAVALSLLVVNLLTRRLSVLEQTMARFERLTAKASRPARQPRGGDEIDRLAGLFKDLAARVEAQMAQLQSVDAARREMLANLSHDLRTPLTTLLAHLESLQMDDSPLDEQERREYIDIAMRQGRRASRLIEQLLEAAKLEAGQVTVRPEAFPIGELLHDVVQKFTLTAHERGIALEASVQPEGLRAYGDIALLERVFDNLIENALRHTPAGGRVTVGATLAGGRAQVTIADSGAGMTAEEAARAFDRFFRGDLGRSTSSGQTGLGLAIVKSILDLHGSAVVVDSRPGHGTRIRFELESPPVQA